MKWEVYAEDNGDLFPVYFMFECLNESMHSIIGVRVNNWMLKSKNSEWEFVIDPKNWDALGSAAYEKLKKEKNFIKAVRERILTGCNYLLEFSEKVHNSDLSKFSNKELLDLFQKYREKNKAMYIWGMIPVVVDFEITKLSDEVRDIISKKVDKELAVEYFIALTTLEEDSFLKLEEKSFLNIAKDIVKNPEAKELFKKSVREIKKELPGFEIYKKIKEHAETYRFFGYGYLGPAWTDEYYLELFSSFIKSGDDPDEKLLESEIKKQEINRKKNEIISKINFSDYELHLFEIARQFGYLKLYRKDVLYKSYYHMHNWLEEVCKRFNLTIKQLRHMIPDEIEMMLSLPDKRILDERTAFYTYTLQNNKLSVLHGKKAREFYDKNVKRKEAVEVDELKGQCSCQGKAIGLIKLIRTVEDLSKMNQGDILISPATNPNLVPAMQKAGAIITDEGGMTCHAAIVSRELGIPCVTGTKVVTKAFKDGDKVEVDASNGIIRRLE